MSVLTSAGADRTGRFWAGPLPRGRRGLLAPASGALLR